MTPSMHASRFPSLRSLHAQSLGTLAHLALEQIDWDVTEPRDLTAALNKQQPRLASFTGETIELIGHCLEQETCQQLFDREATLQRLEAQENDELILEREVPFSCEIDQNLLNGIIDRLVLLNRSGSAVAAEVIDFKTDQFSGSALDAAEKHREQLESYRKAVSRTWGIEPTMIALRILLVRSGEVITL
jgi:ATP-dependent exoDNAse (exonuclease V) beta subunit